MRRAQFFAQIVLVGVAVLLPAAAYAQASIAGVVRDASGGVLPGVTVEAASPALIEKARSVVTDGVGQYKIVDLRPGTYTVTFTLSGFSTARRENIELTGSFTATVNIDLKVGALEETVVVSGESPVVDVQSVRGQPVIDHKVIDTVPASRNPVALAGLVPGVTVAGATDVGGAAGDNMNRLLVHGSKAAEYRVNLDGVPATNSASNGSFTSFTPNLSGTQEIVVDTSNASAEAGSGAPRVNLIPKEGGNTFHGTMYVTGATPSFQASNVTDDLKRRGLQQPNSLKNMYDVNPGVGGPIRRDKMWFYASARFNEADNYNGGVAPYRNANYGNPSIWTYAADPNTPLYTDQTYQIGAVRLTTQATPKNKIGFTLDIQSRVQCGNTETDRCFHVPINRTGNVSWTAPVTSKLLVEAALGFRAEHWFHIKPPDNLWEMIAVDDQGLGFQYRGPYTSNGTQGQADAFYSIFAPRASVSYVTGAHAFKAGYSQMRDREDRVTGGPNTSQITYRFNRQVPNQISEFAYPLKASWIGNQYALYAQDKWTINRLTLSGGVRYDYFHNRYPDTAVGPSLLTPNRNVTFTGQDLQTFKNVTPRAGLAYDLLGDGKTAVKVSINKYVSQFTGQGAYGNLNPAVLMVSTVTRAWTDSNGNFLVDCDLLATGAQNLTATGGDVCGAMSNANFGKTVPNTQLDPELVHTRPYNWEFSTSVQRELGPRVGLNVGYFRRWYGGFAVTDNLLVTAADYSPFSVTAPSDPRLPNGGGYTIQGFLDVNPNRFGQVSNLLAPSNRYGNQIEHWNGVDITLNARLPQGVLVQGGASTGRTVTDNCEILAQVPEANPLGVPYCHQNTGFQTQVKALGAYTVPSIRVQLAANFSSQIGEQPRAVAATATSDAIWGLVANYVAPNAIIAPSLGRNLSGGATATVNLIAPGQMYGERLNVLDLRVGKLLTFGALRTSVNLDINNALNASTVTSENSVYGANWRSPLTILSARLFRISVQMDF